VPQQNVHQRLERHHSFVEGFRRTWLSRSTLQKVYDAKLHPGLVGHVHCPVVWAHGEFVASEKLSREVLGGGPALHGKGLFDFLLQKETHPVPVHLLVSETAQSFGVDVGIGIGKVGVVSIHVSVGGSPFDESDAAGRQENESFVLQILSGEIGKVCSGRRHGVGRSFGSGEQVVGSSQFRIQVAERWVVLKETLDVGEGEHVGVGSVSCYSVQLQKDIIVVTFCQTEDLLEVSLGFRTEKVGLNEVLGKPGSGTAPENQQDVVRRAHETVQAGRKASLRDNQDVDSKMVGCVANEKVNLGTSLEEVVNHHYVSGMQ